MTDVHSLKTSYHQPFPSSPLWPSHAVIKVPSGKVPGEADLQFCADLAAFFSKVEGLAPLFAGED